MSLVFLSLAVAALWINLLGAGLLAVRWVGDYAIARVTGVLAICLGCFCLEHFVGLGPHLRFLPVTLGFSVFLLWRHRALVRSHLALEAVFAAGFCYCLLWRFSFPDIDFTEDKMPNFALIESYMRGVRLPPPDLWLSGFPANCYYSFQHYAAALLGRLIGVGPGVSYHLAYCTMVGFITLLAGSAVARFCPWRPGQWLVVLSLLLGGCGVAVIGHYLVHDAYIIDLVRFLGGSIVHNELTPLGHRVADWMTTQGVEPRDLPMEPFSYFLTKGDFHPPLAGFLLLALAAALIAAQEAGASGHRRALNHALLAATMPVAFISNAWIVPLQCLLVVGWFAYCLVRGERRSWRPAAVGLAAAIALSFPFLLEFTQQPIGDNAAISATAQPDHTPLVGWLLVFWPVVGILLLGFATRERRGLSLYLGSVWVVALVGSECWYNHDLYGGPWARFNSTLKWWQWIYAGIVLTSGAVNLGSRSRLCRYGTVLLLLPGLGFTYDLGRQYRGVPRVSLGQLSGARWIERDVVIRDMITELRSRPDGITLESGLVMANSQSPAVSLFADKQSYLGWPWLEEAWRGSFLEVSERFANLTALYDGKLPDPLDWLVHNHVRYILWLPQDNTDRNVRFGPLREQIKSRYYWHHMYGNDQDFAIGFFERLDAPAAP